MNIPNPPAVNPGEVAKWDAAGHTWKITPAGSPVWIHPKPEGLPDTHNLEWDEVEGGWVVKHNVDETTPADITRETIDRAVGALYATSIFSMDGVRARMSAASLAQVEEYISAVAKIAAKGQAALIESPDTPYVVDFPPPPIITPKKDKSSNQIYVELEEGGA